MKKMKLTLFLVIMTFGMFMMSYSQVGSASVENGITKMSQLLEPEVIASLDNDGDGKAEITGIDPGAGMMKTLNAFISGNDSWKDVYEVLDSSDASMTAELQSKTTANEAIVATLWSPHWTFNKYDLTYLEDDIGLYGGADTVVTLAKQGLNESNAELYNIIERFSWEHSDIQAVMLAIQEGSDADVAAQAWVDENSAKVTEWIGSDSAPDDTPVKFGYVAWSGEIASTNVMKLVLEQAGFTVELVLLDPAALYSGLADGSVDFTTSAWLPLTQASYWEDEGYKDLIDWVAVNLEDAKIGLVIPTYMAEAGFEWASPAASPGFEIPLMVLGLITLTSLKMLKNKK